MYRSEGASPLIPGAVSQAPFSVRHHAAAEYAGIGIGRARRPFRHRAMACVRRPSLGIMRNSSIPPGPDSDSWSVVGVAMIAKACDDAVDRKEQPSFARHACRPNLRVLAQQSGVV